MFRELSFALAATMLTSGLCLAAEFDAGKEHAEFTDPFNQRDWAKFKETLTDDVVFHRANAEEVFVGLEAVLGVFQETIGAPDQWNVKFAVLDSTDEFVGNDGRVVERGDFAVTAGADDGSCYRGSYLMTWVPQSDGDWKLQMLAWQDVETDIANCQ